MRTDSGRETPRRGVKERAFAFAAALAAIASGVPTVAFAQDDDRDAPSASEDDASATPPIGPRQPSKDPGKHVVWDEDWPRFRTWQYVAIGAQAAVALGSQAIPAGKGRLDVDNGFDDSVRDALRARTYDGYVRARDISDVGLTLLINQRFVDSAFVTWWGYDKGSVAWQMAMIDLQTVTFTAAVNGIVAGATARERPYKDSLCTAPREEQTSDCTGNNRYRSFFSGHSSTAFALAGLTCMHHANIPTYGHPMADGAACVGALGVAGTVATARVMADQHWATDVITGSLFGLTSGLTIPYLFHYSGGAKGTSEADAVPAEPAAVTWSVAPTPGGAVLTGSF